MSTHARCRLNRLERSLPSEPPKPVAAGKGQLRRRLEILGQEREPDPPEEERTDPMISSPPPPPKRLRSTLPEKKLEPAISAAGISPPPARPCAFKKRPTVSGALLKIFGGVLLAFIAVVPFFTNLLPELPIPIVLIMIAFRVGGLLDKKRQGDANE